MGLSENICLFLNNFFPRRERKGRQSPFEYSTAQYNWTDIGFKVFSSSVTIKDKVVLDAGCSLGGATVYYSEKGCKSIIGVDLDAERIKHAREFAESKKASNIEFIVGNLAQQPFETNTFDVVFINDVVEHVDRAILVDALKECKRVIKDGGKICVAFPPWTSYDAGHLYDYISIPWCQVLFSQQTLINVINKLASSQQGTMGTLSYIEHFKELNRLTINEFKDMINSIGFKIVMMKPIMILNWNFLNYIPVLNKYFTRRYVVILSK